MTNNQALTHTQTHAQAQGVNRVRPLLGPSRRIEQLCALCSDRQVLSPHLCLAHSNNHRLKTPQQDDSCALLPPLPNPSSLSPPTQKRKTRFTASRAGLGPASQTLDRRLCSLPSKDTGQCLTARILADSHTTCGRPSYKCKRATRSRGMRAGPKTDG